MPSILSLLTVVYSVYFFLVYRIVIKLEKEP